MEIKFSKKYHLVLLSIASGVLLSIAWPVNGFSVFAFVGFVPLFLLEKHIQANRDYYSRGAVVLYSYPAFLVWNILTTWWVSYASLAGGIAAIVLNALFMSLTFGLYNLVRTKVFKSSIGYLSLVFFWIGYEYLHSDWDLNWSWLSLGNVFSSSYTWIQWYEFTGIFGGTAWILVVNVLLFVFVSSADTLSLKARLGYLTFAALIVILPISFSLYMYSHAQDKGEKVEVIAIQPNVDPYNAEFETPAPQMIHNLLDLSRSLITDKTRLIAFPESAIQESIWENEGENFIAADSIRAFLLDYPNVAFIGGASTRRLLNSDEKPKSSARNYPFDKTKFYYLYNTAMCFQNGMPLNFYHKSRLVPGVEKMPFINVMKHFEKFAIDLGGSTGTLGSDSIPMVFPLQNSAIHAAPIICYESIYGELVGAFANRGANLICIITNDGWWDDTPGYKQHFSYARLRAIESRRSVVRSANTGISGFINQRGDAFQEQAWWTRAAIRQELALNNELTFYVKYGDYLARISLFIVGLLMLVSISNWAKAKLAKNAPVNE